MNHDLLESLTMNADGTASPDTTGLDPLLAITSLDGRYASKVASLNTIVSEYGAAEHRKHLQIALAAVCQR